MKRQIIEINEEKCNGCGDCVTACAEGALQIVNGKAKLVRENFCDGFGDCIGECPTGALTIEEREADGFDEEATRRHVLETGGPEALARMDQAAERHAKKTVPPQQPPAPSLPRGFPSAGPGAGPGNGGGCPGSRMRMASATADTPAATPVHGGGVGQAIPSELRQWPVQIHLVQPGAPFFKNRELVLLSTCAPVASADVHWRFLRGRGVAVGCPKLDRTEPYAEKLGAILSDPSIPAVIVVRMSVPCCGGLTAIAREAVELSGRTDLDFREVIIDVDGTIKENP